MSTIALLCTASIAAQTGTGNIYGSAIDEAGPAVTGGTATLSGPASPRTVSLDANGVFRFFGVAPGKYAITLTIPGFATATRENVLVLAGQNVHVEMPMRLTAVKESVTVSGLPPLVDTGTVATGRTFSGEQLTDLPTARDVWSLLQQIPGVQVDMVNVAGESSHQIGGPNIITHGSGNVAYEIDGATITGGGTSAFGIYANPFMRQNGGTVMFFDFSTFENVEASTGGALLDQQNSGTTINVVTKRGTNVLKGSGRFLYASGNWQSKNTPQEAVDQGMQSNDTRYIREYGGDLGGPIIRDRLWLWAAASRQDISVNPGLYPVGTNPFPQTTISEPWTAKLNAQISNPNSASFYFQRSNRLEYGNLGGDSPSVRPPETRTNDIIPANFYKVEDSNVFSADLFGSIFASYLDGASASTPIGGMHRDMYWSDFSFHDSYNYSHSTEPQKQAGLQVSKFFNTGTVSHELKFGFNYRQVVTDSTSGLPGSQNFGSDATCCGGSMGIAELSRGVHRVFERRFTTLTAGDTVVAGNLTLAVGLRYDLQQGKSLPGQAFANTMFESPCNNCGADGGDFLGLPGLKGVGANYWQIQYSNWQPRISATESLGPKKNTLVRASYARFADQMGYLGYWASATPAVSGYYYYWTDLNGDHRVQPDEVLFGQGSLGYVNGINPASINSDQVPPSLRGLKTPTTDEWTAGVEHQITDDFGVSGTFTYRNTAHIQVHLPVGASLSSYTFLGVARGTASANGFSIDFNEPFWGFEGPSSDYIGSTTVTNRPGFTQRYYGLDLSVFKRLTQSWTMRANFGWNNFRQYLSSQSIQNPNNLAEPWIDGVGPNDNGGLANAFTNATWQFNVNGLYQGPWGLAFGVNFFGRQGNTIPYTVSILTNDIYFAQSFLIGRLGTYRYPNFYELDFRLQESFPIGPVTVIPAAELFNVTNSNTVLARSENVGTWNPAVPFATDPNFNQIVWVQSPRIVRLSLQVNF